MQLENTPETYLFKIWPWIEANKIRLAWGSGAVVVAIGLFWFHAAQKDQAEVTAGEALTQLMMTDSRGTPLAQRADLFLKVAQDYKNTAAARRALLQSGAILFDAGQYADAQARFQEFLNQYPANEFAAQAALGVATSLDAQGKADQAAGAYQGLINTYSDVMAQNLARFSLARLDERQNKSTDAMNLYNDIIRSMPNTPLASQAGMLAMELKSQQPAAAPVTTPGAPFKLNP